MERFKFSEFTHFFERGETVAVFHALSREIVFTDKVSLADLSCEALDSENNVMSCLRDKRFIIPLGTDESQCVELMRKSILQHPCIDTLYLLLTDSCNFACKYCFFEGSYDNPVHKTANMTKDLALDSIRKFAGYFKEACQYTDFKPNESSIVFYGGEPLINADTFFAAVEEAAALKKSGDLSQNLVMNINTNGSLVDDKIASFCAKHNIEVDISLDGYQSIHDACRVWRGKDSGTFEDVMRGITILKNAGAKICISCTVTETNVEKLPDIFNWFVDAAGIKNIGFNPLLNSRQYKIKDSGYSKKVTDAMIECFKIARKIGAHEARTMRKVSAFVDGTIYDRDCCGCGKQIVVLPSGKVGVCHAYSGTGKFFIDPDGGFNPYEHPFWKEWSKRSPFNMSQCGYCEALTICGGGCPHNADLNNGSIWEVDASFCIHAKETLQWLI